MKNVPRARNRSRLIQVSMACAAILAGTHAVGQQSLEQILKNGVVVPGKKPAATAATPKQPANQPQSTTPAARTGTPASAPAGFRMDLPPGWRAQVAQNGAVVAAGQDGSAVVIAPVLGAGGADAGTWLQGSGAAAVGQYFQSVAMTGIYQSRMGPSAALASFDYAGPSGAGTANVLCFLNEGVGTLYLIAGPKATFLQQRSGLVRILRSFSFTGERTGGEAAQAVSHTTFTRFRDPSEGAFTIDVPSGWKVEGGLLRKSTLDVRPFVWMNSPDGSTAIHLRDPSFGTFIIPSQMLATAHLQEGMTYTPGYGNIWVIARYLPGPQFAQWYAAKLAADTQTSDVQIKSVNPRQDLSKSQTTGIVQEQTIGGEVEFTCMRNGQECAGKVVAATRLHVTSTMPDSALWFIDLLASFVTVRERYGATDQMLQHMIASTEWNPQWEAMQSQTAYNTGQIAREASQYTAQVMEEVHRNRERADERIHQNRIDTIRGVVRLKDPNTGEELEGVAGRNYYYRAPGGRAFGADREIRSPDLTELEQIR